MSLGTKLGLAFRRRQICQLAYRLCWCPQIFHRSGPSRVAQQKSRVVQSAGTKPFEAGSIGKGLMDTLDTHVILNETDLSSLSQGMQMFFCGIELIVTWITSLTGKIDWHPKHPRSLNECEWAKKTKTSIYVTPFHFPTSVLPCPTQKLYEIPCHDGSLQDTLRLAMCLRLTSQSFSFQASNIIKRRFHSPTHPSRLQHFSWAKKT